MIEGKQTFENKHLVTYSDINNQGVVSTSALIDYLQVIAILHSDEIGYDTNWFLDHKLGWALVGWHVHIHRYPKEKELLTIDTWTENYRRIQANRDFKITDVSGNAIADASSRWFLMNTEKRKPSRLKEEFFLPYLFKNPPACSKEEYKIYLPENVKATTESTYRVIRRDTDTNNHANNVVYIDWAVDAAPKELYDNYKVREVKVIYKKECRLGETVKCKTLINGTDTYFMFTKESDPYTIVCEVYLGWA